VIEFVRMVDEFLGDYLGIYSLIVGNPRLAWFLLRVVLSLIVRLKQLDCVESMLLRVRDCVEMVDRFGELGTKPLNLCSIDSDGIMGLI
jgi:hypothetical protein